MKLRKVYLDSDSLLEEYRTSQDFGSRVTAIDEKSITFKDLSSYISPSPGYKVVEFKFTSFICSILYAKI